MRVVIFQGQYGIFKKDNLDLSMPGIQTCVGLYALSDQHDYLLCAHFDSALRLQENLQDIKQALDSKNINIRSLKATVFGGDGKLSYIRCSTPSSYIGEQIVKFIKKQGGIAEYSTQYYSGFIAKTFNFHHNGDCRITEGENPRDFIGGNPDVMARARERIRLRPSEYSLTDAKMVDISRFY